MSYEIVITTDLLNAIDMSVVKELAGGPDKVHIEKPAGREHYRLLAAVSWGLAGEKVADVGTRFGSSAAALSVNIDVHVKTFDIDAGRDVGDRFPNVTFSSHNLVDDVTPVLDCVAISLDVDPHDGVKENAIVQNLINAEWQGFLLLDDVVDWTGLREWWLTTDGLDVTKYGHASGTGYLEIGKPKYKLIFE